MIITTIKDGFGNQLFMYACGYASAKKSGEKLVLDTSLLANSNLRKYELRHLNIKYDYLIYLPDYLLKFGKKMLGRFFQICIRLMAKTYSEKISYEFDPNILRLKGSHKLYGYWQSEKYFCLYRNELLKMFTLNYNTTDSFHSLLVKIQTTRSVSVHIRRGDFVTLGFCLDKRYYEKAIQLILEKIEDPTFYIFSDDIDYAKLMLKDIEISKEFIIYKSINSTVEDFMLMKNCKHNIIANSTFSWWGAWANENPSKIVICPPRESPDFFYPSDWIILK